MRPVRLQSHEIDGRAEVPGVTPRAGTQQAVGQLLVRLREREILMATRTSPPGEAVGIGIDPDELLSEVDRRHRGNLPGASVIGPPSPGLILRSWPTGHTEVRRVIPRPAPKRRPCQLDPPEV